MTAMATDAGRTVAITGSSRPSAITPTTAAAMPVSAADRRRLPRRRSTCGASRTTKSKDGMNVTQVVSSASRTAAGHGASPGASP